jgi:hypothetical protein
MNIPYGFVPLHKHYAVAGFLITETNALSLYTAMLERNPLDTKLYYDMAFCYRSREVKGCHQEAPQPPAKNGAVC